MKIKTVAILGAGAVGSYHIIKAMEEKNDGKFDYSQDDGSLTCSK